MTDQTPEPCPGFPDNCPNLRTVEPDLVHGGGIRCGCSDPAKTIMGGVIMPTEMLAHHITVAKMQPPDISIHGADGNPLVTIHPDGSLEYGPGYEPDTAARVFWDAIQLLSPWPYATASDPRQAAYDAVFAYIRSQPRDFLPTTVVGRNAMIWDAVHAALDAVGIPRKPDTPQED